MRAFRGMPWGIQGEFVVHSMGIRVRKWGIQQNLHLARVENLKVFRGFRKANVPEFNIIILEGKKQEQAGAGNPSRGSFLEFYLGVSSSAVSLEFYQGISSFTVSRNHRIMNSGKIGSVPSCTILFIPSHTHSLCSGDTCRPTADPHRFPSDPFPTRSTMPFPRPTSASPRIAFGAPWALPCRSFHHFPSISF